VNGKPFKNNKGSKTLSLAADVIRAHEDMMTVILPHSPKSNQPFLKVSQAWSLELRARLVKAGLRGSSISCCMDVLLSIGSHMFNGRTWLTKLEDIATYAGRHKKNISRVLGQLQRAGLIEKIRKGRAGLQLRFLTLPHNTPATPVPSIPSPALKPESNKRLLAAKIRASEIEAEGAVKKTKGHLESWLQTNLREDEIDAVLDREKERQELAKKEAKEATRKKTERVHRNNRLKQLCLRLQEMRKKKTQKYAALLARAVTALPSSLRTAKPTNSIRVAALDKAMLEYLDQELPDDGADNP
jgi:hypothetical protein